MKTKLTNLILVLLVSIVAVACSSEDPIIPEVTVAEGKVNYFTEAMEFPDLGGTKSLNFTSNVDWTLSVSQMQSGENWCMLSQSSGTAGSYDLYVIVEENVGYDDREVVLVLQAGNITKNIMVSQKQKNTILLETNKVEVDAAGGTIEVEVKSNVEYDVEIPEQYRDWISLPSISRTLVTKNLSFIVGESTEYGKRIGEIHFKSGNVSEILKVYQSGSAILLVGQDTYELDGNESIINIELKSNVDYSVHMSDDWITEMSSRGLSDSMMSFKIATNYTGVDRTGKITFVTIDGERTVEVFIVQAAAVEAESLSLEFHNTSGTMGGRLYIGMDYEFIVTATPGDAVADYEWEIDNPDIASITTNGNSATVYTKNYGTSKVIVTDRISGISKSYKFGTCVTDFQFEEESRETQYGYPVIKIEVGKQHQLAYSCTPYYATDIFSNLDAFNISEIDEGINSYVIVDKSSIVDIDSNGMMAAKKVGTTIIEANNGSGVYRSGYNNGVFVEVVQEISPYGKIGGHEYVDLGLPSGNLWATKNFGSLGETDYGAFYKWSDGDVVPGSWGNKWSTPTKEEFNELLDYCTYYWTSKNGVSGYLFTGRNGATMFLPAAGFKVYVEGFGYSDVQSGGLSLIYWSSSKSSYTWEGHSFAFILQGSSSSISADVTYNTSVTAAPIRPISR